MWYIFMDKSDGEYLVLHFDDSNVSDFLLRSGSGDCWVRDISDYNEVDTNEEHPL